MTNAEEWDAARSALRKADGSDWLSDDAHHLVISAETNAHQTLVMEGVRDTTGGIGPDHPRHPDHEWWAEAALLSLTSLQEWSRG